MADPRKYNVPRRAMPGRRSMLDPSERAVDRHLATTMASREYTQYLHFSLTDTPAAQSGARGLRLDKLDHTDTLPHAFEFLVEGVPRWGFGMDGTTTTGNADWVIAFDHSANSGAGADLVRMSPASASTVGTGPKIAIGATGSPAANTAFMLVTAGKGLDCARFTIDANSGTSVHNFLVSTNSLTDNYAAFAFGDVVGANWEIAQDVAGTGSRDLAIFDIKNNKSRATLKSSTSTFGAFGIGSSSPQAMLSATGSFAVADYNAIQRYFCGSYADTPTNRSINLQMIRDSSNVKNYIWMEGELGSASTAVTPLASSVNCPAAGFEATDALFSILLAPQGTNQTINRAIQLKYSSGIQLGFFGNAPVSRSAAYTLAGSAVRVFPTDPSVAYTGINNAQALTPYAQVADLNTLRAAVSTLIGVVRQMATDLGSASGVGLLSA